MPVSLKILASLIMGILGGTAAMAFVVNSETGQEFRAVTWEDMKARRAVNERLLALTDGGVGLPMADSRVTLLAVGDVMLSRMVAQRMNEEGPGYLFEKMRSDLQAAHITFGNLESPILAGRTIKSGEMVFRADTWAAEELAEAGFDVMSLANNHMMNFGSNGLSETRRLLDEVGIAYTGAGEDIILARAPAIIERGNLKFAFLAYTYDSTDLRGSTVPLDISLLEEDISAVREQVDVVIVSMHAGAEYVSDPGHQQIEFAHAAVDAGADLVIGHHPHVVQTAEIYQDKYIFYSLGNFVFDQMWSWDTRRGLGVKFTFSEEGVEQVDLVPVVIDDYAQPRPATTDDAEVITRRLGLEL